MNPPIDEHSLQLDTAARLRRRRFPVSVRSEAAFDVMLALWSALGGDDKVDNHELGGEWFDSFRDGLPAETREAMDRVGLSDGCMWPSIVAYVAAGAPPGDDEELLQWIAAREDLAGALCGEVCMLADPDDVASVIEDRDPEALERVLPTLKAKARQPLATALSLPKEEVGPLVSAIVRSAMETAYADHADEWARAMAASAEASRLLEPTMKPNDLIERVTNGLDYSIPLGMTRLVLIPTVTLRPWTLITEFEDTVVVLYSVADDHMDHDPDAAPGWLVRFHKALGDEKRLRILREVAAGGAGLADLTDALGLAKSTVFHHIGILRAAGLLRVHIDHSDDGGKAYHLRTEAFDDAETQLDKYLEIHLTAEGTNS